MLLVSSCSCLYPIRWSRVLSWEWRCGWSSADRRCSNYIWVINNLIAYWSATYIRDLTVSPLAGEARETVSHPPWPITVTEVRNSVQHIFTRLHYYKQWLQPLTTTWHNSSRVLDPGQNGHTPKRPHPQGPQNLWLPKWPQPKGHSSFGQNCHISRLLPKQSHHFGQNGHTLNSLPKQLDLFDQNGYM